MKYQINDSFIIEYNKADGIFGHIGVGVADIKDDKVLFCCGMPADYLGGVVLDTKAKTYTPYYNTECNLERIDPSDLGETCSSMKEALNKLIENMQSDLELDGDFYKITVITTTEKVEL